MNDLRCTLLLVVCFINASFAQDVKDELIKINEAFTNSRSLYVEVTYNVFEKGSPQALETENSIFYKTNNLSYYKLKDVETVTEDSLQVIVDHAKKVIMLMPKATSVANSAPMSQTIEAALKKCTKVNRLNMKGSKGFELFIDGEEYDRISFSYNSKTYQLFDISFYYKKLMLKDGEKENIRMKMGYRYPKENKMNDLTLHSFVNKSTGSYAVNDRFKAYQLVDYTVVLGKKTSK